MRVNKKLINSIYNARLEIHYDEKFLKRDKQLIKVPLQGKIKCPLLNDNISSTVCSKLMDKKNWPRSIDNTCCKRCDCFVYLSIKKFKNKKKD